MRKRPRKNDDIHNGFDEWGGYMDAKKSKLEEQFAANALKNPYKQSNLFAGISIFVNGLTTPSAEELKRIMMTHGGTYHTYQRSHTTFIIATNLPDVKIRQITSAKIIRPQWIVDCLEANRILDYSKYLLYTNHKVSQPKIAFKSNDDGMEITEKAFNRSPAENANIEDETGECKNKNNISSVANRPKKVIKLNLNMLNGAIRREEDEEIERANEKLAVMPIVTQCTNPPLESVEHSLKQNPMKTAVSGVARTANDPNFLAEFYNNSRLHHIATLGASFKHYIWQKRESHNGQFPIRDQLKLEIERKSVLTSMPELIKAKVVMHIDMDCFFVSVGLRSRPHLKGLPIAVTHSKGRNVNNLQSVDGTNRAKEMELYVKRHEEKYHIDGEVKPMRIIDNTSSLSEIASCSYEARKMGVKNGMFVGQALKLCPQLQTIPYDFDAYKDVAHTLYNTILQYTTDIEAVSCDEMYVDLTNIIQVLKCSVDDFVSHLRNEIIEKTQCTCSAGVGINKLQARMATKHAKPNGQFHLQHGNVEEYFDEIPISDLPGVGYSTTQKCNNLGLKTCADLRQVSLPKLQQNLGKKMGEMLYQNCRGIDNKPLTYDQARKSVSAEVNYGIRFKDGQDLDKFLHQLCTEVHSRLTEISAKGKTITLKYMVRAAEAPIETAKFMGHGFCDNVTKSMTLATHTSDLAIISDTIFNIKSILNVPPHELRGIGIHISKLTTSNILSKKNTLKTMIENVQARQQNTSAFPSNNIQMITSDVDHQRKPSSSFRKVKSFNGTTSPNLCEKPSFFNKKLNKLFENLDLSVLAELPHDIQEEVLRDKDSMLNNEIKNPNLHNIIPLKRTFARKLENDFNDLIDSKPPPRFVSGENILNSTEWRQVLDNWLIGKIGPVECDVHVIANCFKEYAHAQRLTELTIFLKYLYRKIVLMDCKWHRIYTDIHQIVQNEVKIGFGQSFSLYTNEKFDCKTCISADLKQ